ncbi:membrane attack complex component/perforin [Aspergillus terreus]|uniref:Membrane attack complex component/perforin n=1 Tax=Aspergillus terreus TaxID=33178 RepID=A0A5M3YMJ3_ASPTE|nr:hypothetical protein ATETN484_0001008100 [Aspergillus terreus]GFF11862.1 membrane attack complex component/perforin [Aspergillus terreus]
MSESQKGFQIFFEGDDQTKHKTITSTVLLERWKESKKKGLKQPPPQKDDETDEERKKREEHDKKTADIDKTKIQDIVLEDIRGIISLSKNCSFSLKKKNHLVEDGTKFTEYLDLTSQSNESSGIKSVTIYYTQTKTRKANDRKEILEKKLELVKELKDTSGFKDTDEMKAKFDELSTLFTHDLLNSEDYRVSAGGKFTHAEDMTGLQWDRVLRANRLLYGIWVNSKSGEVVVERGRKPVFARKDNEVAPFPRVEVYLDRLDEDGWELSQDCIIALEEVKKERSLESVGKFYEEFGKSFPTVVKLGGRLTSVHHVEKHEVDNITETKNRLKVAAGMSVTGPRFAGSANVSVERQTDDSKSTSTVTNTDKLTWDATGGDTVLASSPSEWAGTVKDFRNWRITEITKAVPLTWLISNITKHNYYATFQEIEHPSLVSIGEPKLSTPPVALVPDVYGTEDHTSTLYHQDAGGLVWEYRIGCIKGSIFERNLVTIAMVNSPLIGLNNPYTTSSQYDPRKNYIRLIFVNSHGYFDELIYDTQVGNYVQGTLCKLKIKLPKGKSAAATSWGPGDKSEVRLFYQDEEDNICHLAYRPSEDTDAWYRHPVPLIRGAVSNTPLAAGHEKGAWEHANKVPFFHCLYGEGEVSGSQNEKMERVYPVYVVREDKRYRDNWFATKLPDTALRVQSKIAVANALSDNPRGFYLLEDSKYTRTKNRTVKVEGEAISIAAAHFEVKGKSITHIIYVYRKKEGALYTGLSDAQGGKTIELDIVHGDDL